MTTTALSSVASVSLAGRTFSVTSDSGGFAQNDVIHYVGRSGGWRKAMVAVARLVGVIYRSMTPWAYSSLLPIGRGIR